MISRVDDKTLREFILGVVDGRIYTSAQVDPNILSMVFMPLALGAFEPEEKPPEEPKNPIAPHHPTKPVRPVRAYTKVAADPAVLNDIDIQIRWHNAPKARKAEYLKTIREQNAALEADYREAVAVWKVAVADWKINEADLVRGYNADLARWRKEVRALDKLKVGYNERRKAHYDEIQRDLGVIYEDISKAGPRSINGQPIFFSFRTLHKLDWERARGAIDAEWKRRQEIELPPG